MKTEAPPSAAPPMGRLLRGHPRGCFLCWCSSQNAYHLSYIPYILSIPYIPLCSHCILVYPDHHFWIQKDEGAHIYEMNIMKPTFWSKKSETTSLTQHDKQIQGQL